MRASALRKSTAEGDKPAARAQVMQLKGAETESMNMQRRALARAGLWRYR